MTTTSCGPWGSIPQRNESQVTYAVLLWEKEIRSVSKTSAHHIHVKDSYHDAVKSNHGYSALTASMLLQ